MDLGEEWERAGKRGERGNYGQDVIYEKRIRKTTTDQLVSKSVTVWRGRCVERRRHGSTVTQNDSLKVLMGHLINFCYQRDSSFQKLLWKPEEYCRFEVDFECEIHVEME